MADIGAVDLATAHEVVTERLRHAIHMGAYLPGDKLPPERALAQQLGVSRMTVREALRTLRDEGYVASQRGSAIRPRSSCRSRCSSWPWSSTVMPPAEPRWLAT